MDSAPHKSFAGKRRLPNTKSTSSKERAKMVQGFRRKTEGGSGPQPQDHMTTAFHTRFFGRIVLWRASVRHVRRNHLETSRHVTVHLTSPLLHQFGTLLQCLLQDVAHHLFVALFTQVVALATGLVCQRLGGGLVHSTVEGHILDTHGGRHSAGTQHDKEENTKQPPHPLNIGGRQETQQRISHRSVSRKKQHSPPTGGVDITPPALEPSTADTTTTTTDRTPKTANTQKSRVSFVRDRNSNKTTSHRR